MLHLLVLCMGYVLTSNLDIRRVDSQLDYVSIWKWKGCIYSQYISKMIPEQTVQLFDFYLIWQRLTFNQTNRE